MSNINQEPPHGRNFNNLFGLLHNRRVSPEFIAQDPESLPWIKSGFITLETHKEIRAKIATLEAHGSSLPLHYRLYGVLSNNGGVLPEAEVRKNSVTLSTPERRALVEHMVPDIVATIHKLEEAKIGETNLGYTVLDDPILIQDTKEVAEGMRDVVINSWLWKVDAEGNYTLNDQGELNSVYPLRGRLLTGNFVLDVITKKIQDTFAVRKNGKIIATFCNTKYDNPYGREPSVELGRTATDYHYLPELKANGLNLRGVSQLRLLHLLTDPAYREFHHKQIEYAYSDIRISGRTRTVDPSDPSSMVLVPDAHSVQGTFFGGMKKGNEWPVDQGFGIWGAGWQYVMGDQHENSGGCEPFLRIGEYLDPDRMQKSLASRTIWVPNQKIGRVVADFLSSSVDVSQLDIRDISQQDNTGRRRSSTAPADNDPVVAITPQLETAYTKIDFINATSEARHNLRGKGSHTSVMHLSEALQEIKNPGKNTIVNHNVPYIEAYCECTTSKKGTSREDIQNMNQIMNNLLDRGFTVTGIIPSDKTDGIRIVFSLITSSGLDKGLEPRKMPSQYYTDNRTTRAINTADSVFNTLRDRSNSANFSINQI